MRNRSHVPRPWWQVGLAVLPGMVMLLRLGLLPLAGMIILSISSVLLTATRRRLFKVPVWGLIPLGFLAAVISMITSLDFYLTCFLLVVTGLLFARHNGLSASLFVLVGGSLTATYRIEPGMYFWGDSSFGRTFINDGMTVLFTILTPVLVLRSRSTLGQTAGLLLPIAAYFGGFVLALRSSPCGFSISQSVSIADPFVALFATMAVAVVVYAWISSRDFTAGEAQRRG